MSQLTHFYNTHCVLLSYIYTIKLLLNIAAGKKPIHEPKTYRFEILLYSKVNTFRHFFFAFTYGFIIICLVVFVLWSRQLQRFHGRSQMEHKLRWRAEGPDHVLYHNT